MSTRLNALIEADVDLFKKYVSECDTLNQVCAKYGYSDHGRNTKTVNLKILELGIDSSHYRTSKYAKALVIDKVCPNCGSTFKVRLNTKGVPDKETCGHACANIYFSWKQGSKNNTGSLKNPNNPEHYRNVLFKFLEDNNLSKSCIVCGETEVLEVHHIDEDSNNNALINLVCLCPTHHQAHHRYRSLHVFNKIVDYIDTNEKLINNYVQKF